MCQGCQSTVSNWVWTKPLAGDNCMRQLPQLTLRCPLQNNSCMRQKVNIKVSEIRWWCGEHWRYVKVWNMTISKCIQLFSNLKNWRLLQAVKEMKASTLVIKKHSNVQVHWGLPEILQYWYYHIRQQRARWKANNQLCAMFVILRRRKSFVSDIQGREHMIINFKSLSNRV